jgi:hypothetical protein
MTFKRKVTKGTLTQEDLDNCVEETLQEALLMISSKNDMIKVINDFCKE